MHNYKKFSVIRLQEHTANYSMLRANKYYDIFWMCACKKKKKKKADVSSLSCSFSPNSEACDHGFGWYPRSHENFCSSKLPPMEGHWQESKPVFHHVLYCHRPQRFHRILHKGQKTGKNLLIFSLTIEGIAYPLAKCHFSHENKTKPNNTKQNGSFSIQSSLNYKLDWCHFHRVAHPEVAR